MRRFERRRRDRARQLIALIGASFGGGALVASLVTRPAAPTPSAALEPTAEPTHVSSTLGRERSAVDTERTIAVATAGRLESLTVPVRGIGRTELRDTFDDARGDGRVHEALDIMAPQGTPVLAVADGSIAKLFTSRAGGITLYQFDDSGNFCFYYAHLDRYADGIAEGQRVSRSQVIGYVGSSGNASAEAPHLHFAIFRLDAGRRWWEGDPINPYPLLARP